MKFVQAIIIWIILSSVYPVTAQIKNGLYKAPSSVKRINETFVIISDTVAYFHRLPASDNYYYFSPIDTLQKQNDSLFSGKRINIELIGGKIYYYHSSLKDNRNKIKKNGGSLYFANNDDRKLWAEKHNALNNAAQKSYTLYQHYKYLEK